MDLNSNAIHYGGRTIDCSPQVTETIFALNQCWPRMAIYGDVSGALWGHHGPDHDLATVRVYISLARKPLREFGIAIEPVNRRGYRLVLPWQTNGNCK